MHKAYAEEAGEEFTRLLMKNQKRIWGLILALVPSGPEAEDVMQETCVVMWRKFGEFETGTDFGAWGLRVARYQVMSYYNRRRRAQARLSDETIDAIAEKLAEPRWEDTARGEALRQCLGRLRPRDLDLIQRRYHGEQRVEQIAASLGGSVHAIYKALARLQTRLLRCLESRIGKEGLA